MFLRIFFSLCSSFLAISASSQAPLLSNLISPRETGFAAVSDHLGLGTHQQSKYRIYFVRMAKSYPSTFQCRDGVSGTRTFPCFVLLLQISSLLALSKALAGGFVEAEEGMCAGNSNIEK